MQTPIPPIEPLNLRAIPKGTRAELVRFYEARLEKHRKLLEDPRCKDRPGGADELRGRIAETRVMIQTLTSGDDVPEVYA